MGLRGLMHAVPFESFPLSPPFLSSSFSFGLPLLFPIPGPYRNGSLRVPFSRFTLPSDLDW